MSQNCGWVEARQKSFAAAIPLLNILAMSVSGYSDQRFKHGCISMLCP